MAGAGVGRTLDAVAVVPGALDDTGVTAMAAAGVEVLLAGDVGVDPGQDGVQVLRGK
jgi:hypothetical protein